MYEVTYFMVTSYDYEGDPEYEVHTEEFESYEEAQAFIDNYLNEEDVLHFRQV